MMQFLGNKLGKNGDGPSNVWKVGEVRRLDVVVVKCAAKEDTSAGPQPLLKCVLFVLQWSRGTASAPWK